MSFLNELNERNREEESVACLKRQKEREQDEAYLKNKTRIDEKIEAIESYVKEINKVSKEGIGISKPKEYWLHLSCDMRGLSFYFQGEEVAINFNRCELGTEDKTGSLSIQLQDITSEKIDSWVRFVKAFGDAPVKLQSSSGRKDAKFFKIIGLIFLHLIGVVYCLEYFYPFRPSY